MFLLYINDIGEGLSSRIKLFANDCLLFREVRNQEDAESLQFDLEKVVQWSHQWLMSFNPKKCSVLKVTQKKEPVMRDYNMCGETLAHVDQQTYLAVEPTKDLNWGPRIQKITTKANLRP